jgi:hypothetical protein
MNEPRDIIDVYNKIMIVIPEQHNKLKKDLQSYYQFDLCYKAPELRKSGDVYIEFANILENYVSNHTNMKESWIFEMQKIFRDEI